MSNQKIIAIAVSVVVLLGGVYFLWDMSDGARFASLYSWFSSEENTSGKNDSQFGDSSLDTSSFEETFTSTAYGFTFKYPEGFNASEFEDDAGVTVLLQKPNAREGFQVYISEFDEEGPITPERIKEDIPDMTVDSPQHVLIGENKDITALIFLSNHESLGRLREVWFVYGGSLFQLTAYEDMDNFIGPILETWSFE